MNLRKSLFTVIAGLALTASIAAPTLAAPPSESNGGNNETTAVVVITEGGEFDASFCSSSLTEDSAPTALVAGSASGTLNICYVDTMSYRANFNTQIQAGTFTSGDAIFNTPIAPINFKVTQTDNVTQEHCGCDGHGHLPFVGDIGAFGSTGYVAQSTLPAVWSTNNTLDTARTVQFGYNGVGTGESDGNVQVALNIPAGTAAGEYESDVTLTIITGTQTKP